MTPDPEHHGTNKQCSSTEKIGHESHMLSGIQEQSKQMSLDLFELSLK